MACCRVNFTLPLPSHLNRISFSHLVTFATSAGCHLDLWGYWHRSVFVEVVINLVRGKSAISVFFQVFIINSGFYQSESLRTFKVVDSQRLSNAEWKMEIRCGQQVLEREASWLLECCGSIHGERLREIIDWIEDNRHTVGIRTFEVQAQSVCYLKV